MSTEQDLNIVWQAKQSNERLLSVLAEQMKLPLLQIAKSAELSRHTGKPQTGLQQIEITAASALKLLDNYLLSTKLAGVHGYLQLEPVSVSAILNETAHELHKFANQYQCDLELHLAGKYEPVMAHKAGLAAALTSLGYVFIEAQHGLNNSKRPVVKLAAHRAHGGIVAGIFANIEELSTDMYNRARQLYGRAHQPFNQITAGSGAGVFVADSLLASMSARLRVARHQKLNGLAATLTPSCQLELI